MVGETLLLVVMVGTLSRAGKLLKTPRIYNAFITSDEKLLPSQAYPAITPVVQGIQYPVPSYVATTNVYQPIVPITFGGATATGGRSFSYAIKQDYFSYNYYENDATTFGAAKLPDIADPSQQQQQTQPLYAPLPAAGLQPLPKEAVPYPGAAVAAAPVPIASEARFDAKKNAYEYQDEQQQQPQQLQLQLQQQQQQQQRDRDDQPGRDDYADSNQAAVAPTIASRRKSQQQRPPPPAHQQLTRVQPARASLQQQSDAYSQQSGGYEDASGADATNSGNEEEEEKSTEAGVDEQADHADSGNYLPVSDFVKNHQQKDPSIVDIPPEPLPIGKPRTKKKKPEEYPPPPLGYVL